MQGDDKPKSYKNFRQITDSEGKKIKGKYTVTLEVEQTVEKYYIMEKIIHLQQHIEQLQNELAVYQDLVNKIDEEDLKE